MSEKFDPYYHWLGIPPGEQPPHHYRLLGLTPFEIDAEVIDNAANQRMAHLRTFQMGSHVAESQRLLNEVAAARVCLLNAEKKSAYDRMLRTRIAAAQPQVIASEVDPLQTELAVVLQASRASTSAIGSKGRSKKSRSTPTGLIAVAAAVVVLGAFGLWQMLGRDGAPAGGATATAPDTAPSAGLLNGPSPRPVDAKTAKPLVASRESKGTPGSIVPPASLPKPATPRADDKSVATSTFASPEQPPRGSPTLGKDLSGGNPSSNRGRAPVKANAQPEADLVAAAEPAAAPESRQDKESSAQPDAAKKNQPPSADEQKRVMAEIDEVYKPGDAKDRAAKAVLARKLLEDGRKNEGNQTEQFVMFRRAAEIAAAAGEAELTMEAVDAIAAAGFRIKTASLKAQLLKRLLEQRPPSGAGQVSSVSEACVKFANEAAAGGAMEESAAVLEAARKSIGKSLSQAQSALRTAKAASARARSPSDIAARSKKTDEAQAEVDAVKSALSALADCARALEQDRREYQAFVAAREKVKTAPHDPAACETLGQWYCFHQSDWDQGLKYLAKASDPELKTLAAEELASKPEKTAQKLSRGDAWWGLAEKAPGKTKEAMRRRAGRWYQEALPDLSAGLLKTTVEHRLAQLSKEDEPLAAEGAVAARRPAAGRRPALAKAPFGEKAAKSFQAQWASYLGVKIVEANSIGMKLTVIPPGEFEMGSSPEVIAVERQLTTDDHWYTDCLRGEGPAHRVRITKPFWMGTVPVTQEQFKRVMGENPSYAQGDLRPVESVSCESAMEFCRRLSALPAEAKAGRKYHLPTEAQWEFSCRAGTTGLWFFSDPAKAKTRAEEEKLGEAYTAAGAGADESVPVGQKRPNPFGLYDMYGTVFQWCQDIYDPDYYAASPADDPDGPTTSKATFTFHAVRGGGFHTPPKFGRSAYRFNHPGHLSRKDVGFRVAAVVAEKAKAP